MQAKGGGCMLITSFSHGIDAKGRIFIPAKWREELGETVFITQGILGHNNESCLFGMSQASWQAFAGRFSNLPITDTMAQSFRRMLFSNAAECELDKQGRILVPNSLREYAGLQKDAMLVGVDTHFEIWAPEIWSLHKQSMEAEYNKAIERLAQLGI